MTNWKKINNKFNIGVGDTVILDAKFRGGSKVKVISLTCNHLFAKIYAKDDKDKNSWQVMTNRLTPTIV